MKLPTPKQCRALLASGAAYCVGFLALVLAGCQVGPTGVLGGRLPVEEVAERPPGNSLPRRWRPPLLAGLDGWMPPRPDSLPPLHAPPQLPTSGSGPIAGPIAGPVQPAAFAQDWLTPSNDRDWIPEHKLLARAELQGDALTVRNVRNCEFYSYRDCLVDHYDKTYRLSELRSVDFLVVPFNENRALAHTMLSFGFEGGDYLGVSVEVRLENGEAYHPATGLLGQFEIIYVVADERDLIRVRTEHRLCDVFAYRSKASPQQAQRLLLDMLDRVNKLHDEPEFYDTLSNNCTTNIVRHINNLVPNRVPYDYRVLLPGFADSLAYELGLIDTSAPFEEVKRRSRINDLALRYKDSPRFSADIRGETVRR